MSFAQFDLGLTKEEFYDMTPRYFDALRKRHQRRIQEGEFMLAQLTAATINFSMCRPKKPVGVKELMPSFRGKEEKPKKVRRSRAAIALETKTIFSVFRRG